MKFIVNYWYRDLSELTGYQRGEEITSEQVLELMESKKCNIMIYHGAEHPICACDDKRFGQR